MSTLNVTQIAEAALAVADERGANGLTMRAVADALGVSPMALYHHVADKAELMGLVLDAAVSERPLPLPTGDWQDDLAELARWIRTAVQAHPVTVPLSRENRRWTPAVANLAERWLAVWQHSGLEFTDAAVAARLSGEAIVGAIESEALTEESERPDESTLAWLPNLRAALTVNAARDPDADFELLVRAVVTGLLQRLQQSTDRPRKRVRQTQRL